MRLNDGPGWPGARADVAWQRVVAEPVTRDRGEQGTRGACHVQGRKNQARMYHVYVEKTQRSKLLLLNNAVKGAGSRRYAQAHAAQYL